MSNNLYQVYKEVTGRQQVREAAAAAAANDSVSLELSDGTIVKGQMPDEGQGGSGEGHRDVKGRSSTAAAASLTRDDHLYLQAVERGDIVTVQRMLEGKAVNVNCVDLLGRSALLIAIDNDNVEIVELLLHHGVQTGDAILHAINEDNVEIVEMLLAKHQKNKKDLTGFFGGIVSSSFTPDITPVILAAHRNNYKILKILLDCGEGHLPRPHDFHCGCRECALRHSDDSLTHSRSRINAYRALASPSLIALSSRDPVLTAFELSWELRRLSRLENEFRAEYEELSTQCKDFAVQLLDQVRTSKELEVILNFDADDSLADGAEGAGAGAEGGPEPPSAGAKMGLSRLWLAVKFKQKRFVAHANCQQLLASIWYEGLPGFRQGSLLQQALLMAVVASVFPLLSVVYIVAPFTAVGRFMRRPFIKFICHTASYVTFLFLLVLDSLRIETFLPSSGRNQNGTTRKSVASGDNRGLTPTEIKWLIIVYVFGFIWSDIKCLWYHGLHSFISDMWRILDFITSMLYITTFTLNLVTFFLYRDALRRNDPYAFASRDQWNTFDPMVVSEGVYAAANVFSILKLVHVFTINPHLGPMQIALGRMVTDVMKFLVLAMLVCFAYSCGVNQLLSFYSQAAIARCHEDCQNATDCNCDKSLADLFQIIQSLYFAVYGLLDVKVFELEPGHEFTEFVGKLMYGTYCSVMIVVLINMFIAMLSNSYQLISNDVDTEWKFARSRLWMSFFGETGTVPPPFNVIPTPKGILRLIQWLRQKLCRCSKAVKVNRWLRIKKFLKTVRDKDTQYQSVIRDVVTRYVRQSQQKTMEENISTDDINEIKHDISSFRFEVLDVLKNITAAAAHPAAARNRPKTSFKDVRKGRRPYLGAIGSDRLPPPAKDHRSSFNDRADDLLNTTAAEAIDCSSSSRQTAQNTKDKDDDRLDSTGGAYLDCSASADSGIETIQETITETPDCSGAVDEQAGEAEEEEEEEEEGKEAKNSRTPNSAGEN